MFHSLRTNFTGYWKHDTSRGTRSNRARSVASYNIFQFSCKIYYFPMEYMHQKLIVCSIIHTITKKEFPSIPTRHFVHQNVTIPSSKQSQICGRARTAMSTPVTLTLLEAFLPMMTTGCPSHWNRVTESITPTTSSGFTMVPTAWLYGSSDQLTEM